MLALQSLQSKHQLNNMVVTDDESYESGVGVDERDADDEMDGDERKTSHAGDEVEHSVEFDYVSVKVK